MIIIHFDLGAAIVLWPRQEVTTTEDKQRITMKCQQFHVNTFFFTDSRDDEEDNSRKQRQKQWARQQHS